MYGKQIVNHIGALGSKVLKYFELGKASRAAEAIDSLDPGLPASPGGVGGGMDLADDMPVPAATGNICTNCGGLLHGPYCATCGQRDRNLRRPVWYLFADLGDEIFSLDSRVFQTLGPLLFLPGALTRGFWEGKRARFVPPIRLYVFASLFFFLMVAVADVAILKFSLEALPSDQVDMAQVLEARRAAADKLREAGLPVPPDFAELENLEGDGGPRAPAKTGDIDYDFDISMFVPIGDTDGEDQLASGAFDNAYKELEEQRADSTGTEDDLLAFTERVLHGFERATQDPGRLNDALNNWIPLTMIVLLPVFAVILRVFYWGRNHRLIKQLVFSLHFHSYIFLILAFLIIAQKVWGAAASSWMFLAAVPLYLFLGLRTASRQGWIPTFFKFLMISVIYVILMSFTVTTAVLMGLADI
ncbi:MAG: DUF3667 domain-containing protein [Proteobacteria bacterium]|nr:DUF3667 domain-containing protein [Pseudomonadota bacterium]